MSARSSDAARVVGYALCHVSLCHVSLCHVDGRRFALRQFDHSGFEFQLVKTYRFLRLFKMHRHGSG